LQETKTLQKPIFFTYKLPPKPQHGRTKLSLKPQHRYPLNPNMLEWSYPLNPNMLEWSYPLNPNIRSAAKREILMGLCRNFLRETKQAAQLPSPKPQHA
jgi:hypothetical protein